MLVNIHSIHSYDAPRTEDVGLPTKFRFNVEPASQPIAGSMPINRLRPGPTLIHHWFCCILCANTWHSPNAIFNVVPQSSTLARHWNSIGWFDHVCWLLHCYAGDAFHPGARNTNYTINWPNTDVMLGHRLRLRPTLFRLKPFEL